LAGRFSDFGCATESLPFGIPKNVPTQMRETLFFNVLVDASISTIGVKMNYNRVLNLSSNESVTFL